MSKRAHVAVQRDEDYYMRSDFLIFEVGDTLFRVPAHRFNSKSDAFGTIFQLLPKSDATPNTNLNVKLPDEIKSEEFKLFLRILYPLNPSYPTFTRTEWTAILKLSTQWKFLEIRKTALQALQNCKSRTNALEKVSLGRELKISKWVVEGYQQLANVDLTLSISDDHATVLGWETTAKLLQIREEVLRNRSKTLTLSNLPLTPTNLFTTSTLTLPSSSVSTPTATESPSPATATTTTTKPSSSSEAAVTSTSINGTSTSPSSPNPPSASEPPILKLGEIPAEHVFKGINLLPNNTKPLFTSFFSSATATAPPSLNINSQSPSNLPPPIFDAAAVLKRAKSVGDIFKDELSRIREEELAYA